MCGLHQSALPVRPPTPPRMITLTNSLLRAQLDWQRRLRLRSRLEWPPLLAVTPAADRVLASPEVSFQHGVLALGP